MYKIYGKVPNENWTYIFFSLTYVYMYIKHCRLKSKVIFPKIDVLVSALNAVQFFFYFKEEDVFLNKIQATGTHFPRNILYIVRRQEHTFLYSSFTKRRTKPDSFASHLSNAFFFCLK